MRVTSGYNPYTYHQQKNPAKNTGYSAMRAGVAKDDISENQQATIPVAETDVKQLYEEAAAQTVGMCSNTGIADKAGISNLPFMLLQSKVDTTRKLNEASLGDKELTPEQITELMDKYDVNNLSYQEQYDLFCDLTNMGVLTADDVRSIGMGNIIMEGVMMPSGDDKRISLGNIPEESNFYNWMMARVHNEQFEYEYMMKLGRRTDLDESDGNVRAYTIFKENISKIDSLMTSHQKVADVLQKLVRPEE